MALISSVNARFRLRLIDDYKGHLATWRKLLGHSSPAMSGLSHCRSSLTSLTLRRGRCQNAGHGASATTDARRCRHKKRR